MGLFTRLTNKKPGQPTTKPPSSKSASTDHLETVTPKSPTSNNKNDLYSTLHTTATSFVLATNPLTPNTNTPNPDLIRSLCAPNFTITWGHSTFISTVPPLQGTHDADYFVNHMGGMTPKLETWSVEVEDVVVDEKGKKAVVRCSYVMVPKGEGSRENRTVVNEVVWWLGFAESGERVETGIEFVDPVAAGRIREMVMRQGR